MNNFSTIFTNHGADNLHMVVFWICMGICLIAFITLLYALIFYRRSLYNQSIRFHKNPIIEIAWFIIPFFIFALLVIPAAYILVGKNRATIETTK